MQVKDTLYIGGEWVKPAGDELIEVISPHTEDVIATVPDGTPEDMDRAVAAARQTFDETDWPRLPLEERLAIVQRFTDLYAARMMDMAAVITEEMGSPITFSQLAQSPTPWMMLNTFIGLARELDWEEERPGVMGGPVIVLYVFSIGLAWAFGRKRQAADPRQAEQLVLVLATANWFRRTAVDLLAARLAPMPRGSARS